MMQITPDIEIPASAGQKQHGSAKFMALKEKEKKFKGSGIVIGMTPKKGAEKIYTIGEDVHTLGIGATRSGKSRSIVLQSIGNLADAGESIIISDPKGELWDYTNEYVQSKGYEVLTVDFKNPKKSSCYNFLQPIIDAVKQNNIAKGIELTWDLTSVLVGNNKSNEKIWENGEASVIASSIMSVVVDNQKTEEQCYQNLTNTYYFIAEMTKTINGKMPIEAYIKSLLDTHPARGLLSIADVAPSKTRGSFYTSALTTLRLFTSPLIYTMTNTRDFDPAEIGRKKIALYIILPDEKTTYYPLASLLVNQIYTALVNEADQRGGRLKNRVNFILDEFGNFSALPDFSAKLTVGAGRGIRFALFVQGLMQLEEKYNKEVASIIKGNCEIWIYLQANDSETLEEISKKLGKYTVSTYSLGSNNSRYSSPSSSQNISLMGRELLTPDEIKLIKRPYILVLSKNRPAIFQAPDISEYHYNELFGMGDQEHNRILRKEREEKREEKNKIQDLKLWNIWKFYASQLENTFTNPFERMANNIKQKEVDKNIEINKQDKKD